MAEAVGSALELDRHERLAQRWLVEAPAVPEDVVDQRLTDEERQELVEHQPVVMPRRQAARLPEHLLIGVVRIGGAYRVDRAVVEEQERRLQPGDDHALVVAGVGDDRGAVGHARHVLEQAARLDLQLGAVGIVSEHGLQHGQSLKECVFSHPSSF